LYSAISDTSDPDRRYFGSAIAPAPSTGTNLLATAIQSFEKITRFKGEKSLYNLSRQQKAKAIERTCSFYVYLQADPHLFLPLVYRLLGSCLALSTFYRSYQSFFLIINQ
jgi:hypothetical protein